jgi:antirestriction protein ArdC
MAGHAYDLYNRIIRRYVTQLEALQRRPWLSPHQ